MVELELSKIEKQNGVYVLTEINNEFESVYIKVRKKEKRIYPDDEVAKLPFASDLNPHKNEWDQRAKSFIRLKNHLKSSNENLNILDLGSGNGWLCGNLSGELNHNFFCLDVNLTELEQGARVFGSKNVKFIYAEIFKADLKADFFDLIIANASVQYFPDIKRLINRLFRILKHNGEIRILDSPFYSRDEVENARKRTERYYLSVNFPEMTKYYHHHTYEKLSDFDTMTLYNPSSFKNKLKKIILVKDSPFPYIKIKK